MEQQAGQYASARMAGTVAGLAQREAQIPSAIARAEMRLHDLASAIDRLESRLSPLLQQSAPQVAGGDGKAPREVTVPLADLINSHAASLGVCTSRIESLMQRLEI